MPALAPEVVRLGLVWVSDAEPRDRRERRGDQVHDLDTRGKRIRDEATLARIRKPAIPPAYEDAWICAKANGRLQAIGRDARGRRRYRHHPKWQQQRGDGKFEAMRAFGVALHRLRRNDARGNGSHGLTTLRTRQAGVHDAEVRLSFKGKSGLRHEVKLSDRRVAAVVRRCKALPGQELFQYADADGGVHKVNSSDVNDYLCQIAGTHVTANDSRRCSLPQVA